mgnify:FL=1
MRFNFLLSKIVFWMIIQGQFFISSESFSEVYHNDFPSEYKYRQSGANIKTVNGKFYAYTVLLFNDNPHFVNLIQKGTISLKEIGIEGFNIKAYRNYLATIQDNKLTEEAELVLKIYLEPDMFNNTRLRQVENYLAKRNIILKFYREGSFKGATITLDYCIYGEKVRIDIKHPLFHFNEEMFYIKPYIYYDEFSTSNSTFYYDMIYINPDEVTNDYIIAKNIVNGKDIKSMFFNGSKVTDDIKQCLVAAFRNQASIRADIWKMFVIHELTHKIMNNHYNNYDQITGEEIALSSTIYSNPHLGLSIMYSYLNYGKMNPHRMAAMNYITYLSEVSGKKEYVVNPSLIKNMAVDKLKEYTKNHFYLCLNKLKTDN